MLRALAWAAALAVGVVARADVPARAEFSVPALSGPVVDDAGVLSAGGRAAIGDYLARLREAGGTQITVLTVPSLGGVAIEEASIKVFDAWKLGGAKIDDGVLLLVAAGERRVRIEVGRGREGELPDVVASRIIREVIAPRLRAGSVDRAVAAGVRAIARQTDPQLADEVVGEGGARGGGERPLKFQLIQFLFLLALIILFVRGGGGFWGGFGGGLGGGLGGGWGDSGGSGWSGGGGGSAGGGASGDW